MTDAAMLRIVTDDDNVEYAREHDHEACLNRFIVCANEFFADQEHNPVPAVDKLEYRCLSRWQYCGTGVKWKDIPEVVESTAH